MAAPPSVTLPMEITGMALVLSWSSRVPTAVNDGRSDTASPEVQLCALKGGEEQAGMSMVRWGRGHDRGVVVCGGRSRGRRERMGSGDGGRWSGAGMTA